MNPKSCGPGTKGLALLAAVFCLAGLHLEAKTVAVRGGKVFTVSRGIIDQGVILIREGRISAVGRGLAIPAEAEVIDASKCLIFPGFIDGFTNLGASDVESVEQDSDEATSPLTPHLRIIDGLDPANKYIPAARQTGLTMALVAPGVGNLISGQSALVRLAGNDVAAMTIKFPVAVHVNLGEPPKLRYGGRNVYPSTRMGEAALLRQTLVDAQGYLREMEAHEKKLAEWEKKRGGGEAASGEKPVAPPANLMLQALVPVVKGELPVIITANRVDDILTALRIAEEFKLRVILNQGGDAYRVKEKLAAGKIPVILNPKAAYRTSIETGMAVFESAALLWKAGVKIAFQTGSFRNFGDLLQQAQTAIRYGLPVDEALRALTLGPAEILGVADELGSIEAGKAADLVVFEGNPLTSPARLKTVIIRGRVMGEERQPTGAGRGGEGRPG